MELCAEVYRTSERAERPAPWHARNGGEQKRRFEGGVVFLSHTPSVSASRVDYPIWWHSFTSRPSSLLAPRPPLVTRGAFALQPARPHGLSDAACASRRLLPAGNELLRSLPVRPSCSNCRFALLRLLPALVSSRFASAPARATTWCQRRPSQVRQFIHSVPRVAAEIPHDCGSGG